MAEQARLLDAIQKELTAAMDTDEEKMVSYLVHDQPQEVEIEELKSRLNARKIVEVDNFKRDKAKQANIETEIRNLLDNIEETNEDLTLEGGPLLTASRSNKTFRCMAFNPANIAGNEVTGTASGGVENFVVGESNNVHLLDIHNGELLHIFVGDKEATVGEKRGHVVRLSPTCLPDSLQ